MQRLSPGGTIARLGAETGVLQGRLERELAALGASATGLDYQDYLCRMYGFLAPVERALGATPGMSGVIGDADRRNRKASLIALDLASLGVDRAHLAQLPRASAPLLDELPESLGWMYVVEAGTLDGESLARQLALRLPAELSRASAFLRCYGDDVAARWRAFGAGLDAYVARAEAGVSERVVLAATECLIRLHRWLAVASPSQVQLRAVTA